MADLISTQGIVVTALDRTNCPHCGQRTDISGVPLFKEVRCPQCEKHFSVPGVLGDFLLLGLIGRGGMGAVYLAEDRSLRRKVALKIIRKEFGSDEAFYESFTNEAQAAARLNHVNVAQLYSFGQEEGQPYIVMELVHGERLDELMKQGTTVEEETLLRTAIDVAQGLEAAERAGLVHGDIKPANILYDASGRAKIVDFGLAGQIGRSEQSSTIWGTPFYISPEKARKKREDQRSDQYSFGCTLWHALVGRPPFDGNTPSEVVLARMDRPAPKLQDADASLSPAFSAVVERMMDPNPARRYPTYASLLADLHDALKRLPEWNAEQRAMTQQLESPRGRGAKPGRSRRTASMPAGAPAPKAPVFRFLFGGLVVGGLVTGGYALYSGSQPSPVKGPALSGKTGPASRVAGRTLEAPFLPNELQQLKQVEEAFAQGATFRGEALFNRVRDQVPQNSTARRWLELQQALRMTMAGKPELAAPYVEALRAASATGKVTPENLVPLLTGKVTFEAFSRSQGDLPAWYLDLAAYSAGAHLLAKGNKTQGETLVKRYADRKQGTPGWVYLPQDGVRRSLGQAAPPRTAPPKPLPAPPAPAPSASSKEVPGMTNLFWHDFEAGQQGEWKQVWSVHDTAGLYHWPGEGKSNWATSGKYALVEDSRDVSYVQLKKPLQLLSDGYTEVLVHFHFRWPDPARSRRLYLYYSADAGKTWKEVGNVNGGNRSPARFTLRAGTGPEEFPFTDEALFRLNFMDANRKLKVYIDDLIIHAR